ncbi:MAG: glycosyl transferase [Rubrivivax sp.]|nr:MAG: glycosyl transferase [Rubrivivax sp.]
MNGRDVTVSIVSHGHGWTGEVQALLQCLHRLSASHVSRVVVTLNIPEPALDAWLQEQTWPFEVRVLRNARPRGFGANHNAAFGMCSSATFCVLNPDIRFVEDPFGPLLDALTPGTGCSYPRQTDGAGRPRASARAVPSLAEILRRRMFGRATSAGLPLYAMGFFLLLRAEVYRTLHGFDEGFFMYCEDVDLSIRLQLGGWRIAEADASVIHAHHAASHRHPRHLAWHVASLLRLWRSPGYARLAQLRDAP